MPKSKRGKGKYQVRKQYKAALAKQPVTESEPVTQDVSPAPVKAPVAAAKPEVMQYPYVKTELKFIGILSAAIVVVLVVLAIIWS